MNNLHQRISHVVSIFQTVVIPWSGNQTNDPLGSSIANSSKQVILLSNSRVTSLVEGLEQAPHGCLLYGVRRS